MYVHLDFQFILIPMKLSLKPLPLDEALFIFEELTRRCLFEDARIMSTFIRDIKSSCCVSYSRQQSLFVQKKFQAILRLPCNNSLEHFFSLHSLLLINMTMDNLVCQPVWLDKLLTQSQELMKYASDDPFIIYLRAIILFSNNENEDALSLLANCVWHCGKGNFLIWKLFILNVPSIEAFYKYTKGLDCFMKTLSLLFMGAKLQFFIPYSQVQSFVKANYSNPYIATLNAAFHANQNQSDNVYELIESVKFSSFFLDFADIFSHFYFTYQNSHESSNLVENIKILNKRDYTYYIVMGNHFSLMNNHHSSIKMFQIATTKKSLDPLPWLLMGFEYFGMENKSKALECYYSAYRLSENDYRVLYALGYFNEKSGFYARAIQFYSLLVELRPFDARFTIALAENHGYLEHYEEMLKYALKAHKLSNFAIHANIVGIAYKNVGRRQDALTYFIKALQDEKAHEFMRIEDCFFSVKQCIYTKNMDIGRQFFNLLSKYPSIEIYANEVAILEESLDSTWKVDIEGNDMISLPEISAFENTVNSFKSIISMDFTPSRIAPRLN
eukprot:NODE_356_length_10223_cov_0.363098.p2 type:complete len:556 gc:universal NODE_356_length_10223_cov_0.363098:8627-6960(-)